MRIIFTTKRKNPKINCKNFKKTLFKKSASAFLCLFVLISNTLVVNAVEVQKDSYILDIDEGRVWAEEIGRGKGEDAKKSVEIKRLGYNYHVENPLNPSEKDRFNTIDWEITFNKNKERRGSYLLYVLLPKTDPASTMITRTNEAWGSVDNLNVYKDYQGYTRRWGYENPMKADSSDKFNSEYSDNFQACLQGSSPGSNMNAWRDLGRLKRIIISGEGAGSGRYVYRITTYHEKDVALENVPMFALMCNARYGHRRMAAIGPFGIAAWHELNVPKKRVYVDDVDNITESDKKRIFGVIKEDTDAVIAGKTGDDQKNYKEEEDGAREDIVDNTYVKTFSDGSKLKLSLKAFVRQREIYAINQENEINWKQPVDIDLGVNDPDFKNEMMLIPATGSLPQGLVWDETRSTEYPQHGEILGTPRIDWSQIQGENGKKEAVIKFNVALKKEDGTINEKTIKPITIRVKQDEGAVPVGIGSFHLLPFVLLMVISVGFIGFIIVKRRGEKA